MGLYKRWHCAQPAGKRNRQAQLRFDPLLALEAHQHAQAQQHRNYRRSAEADHGEGDADSGPTPSPSYVDRETKEMVSNRPAAASLPKRLGILRLMLTPTPHDHPGCNSQHGPIDQPPFLEHRRDGEFGMDLGEVV